jgi:SAM-dependent methyltransferase
MKLSDLVAYRALLDEYSPADVQLGVSQLLDPVRHVIASSAIQYPDLNDNLARYYNDLQHDLNRFETVLGDVRNEVQKNINAMEPSYFAGSYRLYEQEMCNDSTEVILNRRFSLDHNVSEYLRGRILLKADWHRPGAIIRPGLESWIEDLVALDPLYLVDQDHALLEPALSRFNSQYQRRLRKYIIKESSDQDMLTALPDDQFGFFLVYNFFHYKPFEVVKKYLQEIYQKLIPGGVLAFTFNDCDLKGAVELAERSFMCYTPGYMIKALVESIGFEIQQQYQIDAAAQWIEMVKPGSQTTLRGGQALARIIDKAKPVAPEPEIVYTEPEIPAVPMPRVYTQKDITRLRKEAIALRIDHPLMIKNNYTPETLDRLIKQRKKNARPLT